jgi:uncharacterized protein
MIALITEHREEIEALCREFGVLRLEIFGSAATGEFDPERSDIDFLVEYPKGYDFGLWFTRYFDLRDRLEALLGRRVDLIMVGAMRKPHFIESVNKSRRLLYAA